MFKFFVVSVSLVSLVLASQDGLQSSTTEKLIMDVIKDYIRPELPTDVNKDNQSEPEKVSSAIKDAGAGSPRMGRAKISTSMRDLFGCAVALDAPCLLDTVQDIVDNANRNLLKQADEEARKMTAGRAKGETQSPSSIIQSIAQLMLEVPELLRDSVAGFFRGGKEEDDDESEDEEEEEETADDGEEDESEDEGEEEEQTQNTDEENAKSVSEVEAKETKVDKATGKKCTGKRGGTCIVINNGNGDDDDGDDDHDIAGRKVGGARGKKKKQKKKQMIKLLIFGLILKAKITLLLKILAAKLQLKFLFIAFTNLVINLARFWWDLKKGHDHQPQKVIYYEHAQHQHHYDGTEDWEGGPGGSGGYWARNYPNEEEDTHKSSASAQNLAYAKQIPPGGSMSYTQKQEEPVNFWNMWG